MKVRWRVEDGLVQGAEFTTDVDDSELAMCEDETERELLISECIQDDFEARVSWSIVSKG